MCSFDAREDLALCRSLMFNTCDKVMDMGKENALSCSPEACGRFVLDGCYGCGCGAKRGDEMKWSG